MEAVNPFTPNFLIQASGPTKTPLQPAREGDRFDFTGFTCEVFRDGQESSPSAGYHAVKAKLGKHWALSLVVLAMFVAVQVPGTKKFNISPCRCVPAKKFRNFPHQDTPARSYSKFFFTGPSLVSPKWTKSSPWHRKCHYSSDLSCQMVSQEENRRGLLSTKQNICVLIKFSLTLSYWLFSADFIVGLLSLNLSFSLEALTVCMWLRVWCNLAFGRFL